MVGVERVLLRLGSGTVGCHRLHRHTRKLIHHPHRVVRSLKGLFVLGA